MQTKPIRWTRRILACVTVLCLMATGLDVKPVLAFSPQFFSLDLAFVTKPPKPVCVYQTVEIVISAALTYKGTGPMLPPPWYFDNGWIESTYSPEVGALLPKGKV